jgi:phosphoesterase RecJ-like protein
MLTQEQQIFEQIKKAKNILITFSAEWSGDAVSSALALNLFLKKLGKQVDIVADSTHTNSIYSFLSDFTDIKSNFKNLKNFIISLDTTNTKVEKVKYNNEENKLNFIVTPKEGNFTEEDISSSSSKYKYDLIISIDSPDIESLGKIFEDDTEFFYKIPLINIDNHSENEEFGQINLIDLTAVSSSEILFNLLSNYSRDSIDENIATALLTGIISKTKSFKTQNVTPDSLSTVAQLISMGADRELIVNTLYRSRTIGVLKLWGRVLARLNNNHGGKLVWSVLSHMDFHKTQTSERDLSEVIDELIVSIPEARIIVLIYEVKEGEKVNTKTIIHSMKGVNALQLSKEFNSSGTKNLAKFSLEKSITEAEKHIIEKIKENLTKLSI